MGEEGYHIDPSTHEKLSEAGKKGGSARWAKEKNQVSVLHHIFKVCTNLSIFESILGT